MTDLILKFEIKYNFSLENLFVLNKNVSLLILNEKNILNNKIVNYLNEMIERRNIKPHTLYHFDRVKMIYYTEI